MKKTLLIVASLFMLTSCAGQITQADNTEIGPYKQEDLSEDQLLKSLAIYDGVKVEGIDLGGANILVAEEKLTEELDPLLDEKVEIIYNDNIYEYSYRDLGFSLNYDEAIDEAYSIAREGAGEERLAEIEKLAESEKNIDLDFSYDESYAEKLLTELQEETRVEAEGGQLLYDQEEGSVYPSEGEPGSEINIEDGLSKIAELDMSEEESLSLSSEETLIDPDVEAMAQTINGPIGTSTSYFQTWFWQRAENVRISSQELNGYILYPGETFSFNEFIGDTPYERGYQDAVIIMGTTEVPGKGGGVCQTSTALYHAALRAGLEIVERHPHTLIMPYSPGGLDAAVDYGIIDLQFKNNYDFPVLFKSYYHEDENHNGEIGFEIWGDNNKVATNEYEIYSYWNYDVPYGTVHGYTDDGQNIPGVTGSSWGAYRENTETGEVEYLADTYYPAVTEVIYTE